MNHKQAARRPGPKNRTLTLPSSRKQKRWPIRIDIQKAGKVLGQIFLGVIVATGIYLFVVVPAIDLNRYLDWIEDRVQRKAGAK